MRHACVFSLEGIRGHQQEYIKWLPRHCINDQYQPEDLIQEEAIAILAERLTTPLHSRTLLEAGI